MSGTGGRLEGVVLIAGTGTVALGYTAAGESARCQGWGPRFMDQGSGYDLGHRALAMVARCADGQGVVSLNPDHSAVVQHLGGQVLTERVLHHCGCASPAELLDWAYSHPDHATAVTQIAGLARVVLACAEEDDAAEHVVREAAAALACAVGRVRERLPGGRALPLVLAGGLLQASGNALTEQLLANLEAADEEDDEDGAGAPPAPVFPAVNAATGAALLAKGMCEAQHPTDYAYWLVDKPPDKAGAADRARKMSIVDVML